MRELSVGSRSFWGPNIHLGWATVTGVTLTILLWMLYSPGSAQSTGVTLRWLEDLLRFIPGMITPSEPGFDKIAHATGFATVTAAALLTRWNHWWVIGLSVAHAGLSEVIQWLLIPGRSGDPADFCFDVGGILLAWTVVAWWSRHTLTEWRIS
ncbi:MAG: VanZ family protein [Actinomycetaceae bacterium]|nr:VanZ family protein [Actinomycetaceae bacterium]